MLKVCAQRLDEDVRPGSINVTPDAQCQAACALNPLGSLLRDSQRGYFNEAFNIYV